jgi:cytochrome c-type biogenesis protein CcmH/NrfG
VSNLAEAKESALQAVAMDANHDEPSLYLLLAEIYVRQGDGANAIVQLQQFLKHPTDRPREDAARQLLAKLESQQPTR